MIVTETITIKGKEYRHIYSDDGHIIRCGRKRYIEAVDPIDIVKAYFEEGVEVNDAQEE